MATPTYPSKRYYACGAAKSTTWGTALATGAAKGLLILKDGNIALKCKYIPNEEIDQVVTKGGVVGPMEGVDFALEFSMRYDPGFLGNLIASLFGTAGAPSGSAPVGYTHLFAWADSYAQFFTVAVERPGYIWEVQSAVPYKLNLKNSGGFIQGVLSMRGNGWTDASAVNTLTQMDAITYLDTGNRVRMSEGVFRMNAQGGAALSGSDALDVSDFDITYERVIDNLPIFGLAGICQPKESAVPKFTAKIKLPRTTAANLAFIAAFQAGTSYKADMVFTGPVIATTYHYTMTLTFQRLLFSEPPEAPLDGIIATTLNMEAQEAAAAPTGQVGTRPSMGLVNLLATGDFLA